MVSQATLNKQANALITLYVKEYSAKYNRAPNINRYREKWGFISMVEDLGYERAQKIIEYYFTTGRIGHPVQGLLQNYDRLNRILTEMAEDEKNRERLRRETEQRVREWEAVHGNESG